MDKNPGKGKRAYGKGKTYKIIKNLFFSVRLTLCLLPFAFCQSAYSASSWSGVDESVIEKIAGEHDRHAVEPLINTDKGDLLLFVFLLAGAVGGFAAGYYWRMLMEGKGKRK
jgi:ABC-type cobalt transport system substrate-binding protein